jgi:foldase protein PrsA
MKRIRFIAILLAAAFALTGCNIIKVNPQRDGAQIVATVNGENITKKQVYDAAGITWDKKVETWQKDQIQTQKEQAMESLIDNAVVKQKAKELGFYNFNADEQKSIDDSVNAITKSTYDAALKTWQDKAKDDTSINPEQKAQQAVVDYLATLGTTLDEVKQSYADSQAQTKLKKSITDPVEVTDTDITNGYNTRVTAQKASYDKDPTQLVNDDLNGTVVVYYPTDGFVRVKHILLKIDDTTASEISQLRKDNKNADADAKRAEALKALETKAQDALTKAKAASGNLEALDKLVTDLGEDTGMAGRTLGYPTYKDYTGYATEFQTAAMALKDIGVPSELVASDFGYHIMWLTDKPAKGNVPMDSVKAHLSDAVLAELQSTAWQNAATQWIQAAKISRYSGRLSN